MTDRPVLFLDFDGVLHRNRCLPGDCFNLLPALAGTLAPFDHDIVISSSWRFHYSIRYLTKLFPDTLRNRIIGTTGEGHPGSYARWEEIQAYLECHPTSNWRALDDFDWEFPPACPQLIHCDGDRGCQDAQRRRIENWLSGNAD